MTYYKFRLNHSTKIGQDRFEDFIVEVGNSIEYNDENVIFYDMLMEYDRSDIGRTTTTDKRKADAFLQFLSQMSNWNPKPHPVKWKMEVTQ